MDSFLDWYIVWIVGGVYIAAGLLRLIITHAAKHHYFGMSDMGYTPTWLNLIVGALFLSVFAVFIYWGIWGA